MFCWVIYGQSLTIPPHEVTFHCLLSPNLVPSISPLLEHLCLWPYISPTILFIVIILLATVLLAPVHCPHLLRFVVALFEKQFFFFLSTQIVIVWTTVS